MNYVRWDYEYMNVDSICQSVLSTTIERIQPLSVKYCDVIMCYIVLLARLHLYMTSVVICISCFRSILVSK